MSRPRPADWRDVVARWQASGMTVRAFSRAHDLPNSTLRDWVKAAELSPRIPHPLRQHYDQVRAEGLSPWKASLAVGVSYRMAKYWSQQQ
jgi:transposase-like protein